MNPPLEDQDGCVAKLLIFNQPLDTPVLVSLPQLRHFSELWSLSLPLLPISAPEHTGEYTYTDMFLSQILFNEIYFFLVTLIDY